MIPAMVQADFSSTKINKEIIIFRKISVNDMKEQQTKGIGIELSLFAESFITIRPGNIDLGPSLERLGSYYSRKLFGLFLCSFAVLIIKIWILVVSKFKQYKYQDRNRMTRISS